MKGRDFLGLSTRLWCYRIYVVLLIPELLASLFFLGTESKKKDLFLLEDSFIPLS